MEEMILRLLEYNPTSLLIIAIVFLGILLLIVKLIHGDFNFLKNKYIRTFKSDLKDIKNQDNINLKKSEGSILLGQNPNKKDIYLKDNAKNVYVVGTTGSGKSVALSNFIKYGVDKDIPMLIIDGKGSTDEGSLLDITNKLKKNKKVYIIDLNNPITSDKYNPFCNTSYTVVKDMLINMTDWSEEHYKYNTERYLQKLVELLVRGGIKLSFKSIIEHMNVESFKLLSTRLVNDDILTKEEHIRNMELLADTEKIIQGAYARFCTIFESELGAIFDDDGIDIYKALEENAIILFVLNPLIYPELSKLIGRLIIIDSKKAVSNLYKNRIERGFFIFDEINVYASTSLLDLVNKSRSANITSILASQSLSDLEENVSEHFKEQIIENCNNYIVLRQNSSKNSEAWANIIGTKEVMDMTYQIKSDKSSTIDTGLGSARRVREFLFHPDEIKNLKTGHGFLVSKDNNFKSKIIINKPF